MAQLVLHQDAEDEIEALFSVFSDDIQRRNSPDSLVYCTETFKATFYLPLDYPLSPPTYQIDLRISSAYNKSVLPNVISDIESIIKDNPSSHVLFYIIEALRTKLDPGNKEGYEVVEETEQKKEKRLDPLDYLYVDAKLEEQSKPTCNLEIFHGEPYVERKSVFQAHFARVRCMEDVKTFRQVILSNPRCARATHNIFVFRFTSKDCCYHDHDDDGETAAGSRLAEILRLMEVDGIAIIVTRWFGGTLLGADRFKIINNTARQLLEKHGIVSKKGNGRN